jgi:branched-chain amino acid transport system substrate-binding protein
MASRYNQQVTDYHILGADVAITGVEHLSGKAVMLGIRAAANTINSRNGLLGRKVRVIPMDNMGNPAKSEMNIEQLSKLKNLAAVFGGKHTNVVSSTVSKTNSRKIPYLISWASGADITDSPKDSFVFRFAANDRDSLAHLTRKLTSEADKIGLFIERTDAGDLALQAIIENIPNGYSPPIIERFSRGEDFFAESVIKMLTGYADAVVYYGPAAELYNLTADMIRIGMTSPIYATPSILGSTFTDKIQNISRRPELFIVLPEIKRQEMFADFDKILSNCPQCRNTPNRDTAYISIHTYDLAMLYFAAAEKAGTTNPAEVKKALENLESYHGLSGAYHKPFSQNDHDIFDHSNYYILKLEKNEL